MNVQNVRLVLASKSRARAAMLAQAGLEVDLVDAAVDERVIDADLALQGASTRAIAEELSKAKALAVSRQQAGQWVIGADQTLECAGKRYSKAKDRDQAARHLREFSGKTHALHAAVALAYDGRTVWSCVSTALMSVRPLSEDFITRYLAMTGDSILGSVGCYHYEGLGLQLFDRVEGDFHTILGMPLLPLLIHLRQSGLLLS